MTLVGLLNGRPFLDLEGGGSITVATVTEVADAVVAIDVARVGGRGMWRTRVEDLDADPTEPCGSQERSFAALEWADAGLVLLAGHSGCAVLSLRNGAEISRHRLAFIDRGGIDILELALSPDQRYAIAISTKRVLVYSDNGALCHRYDATGLVRSAAVVDDSLIVHELDVLDPALAEIVVRETLA